MYAAILFDLDNTLIDRDAAFCDLVKATFPPLTAVMDELVRLDNQGLGDREQLCKRWQALGGERVDASTFGVLIAKFVDRKHELLSALRDLARTTELAIVTNGGTASQVAKWRAAGLDSVFPRERLWISAEVGIEKPDPEIFRIACNEADVQPHDCLFVGDQAGVDIAGAEAAGMSTILARSPLTSNQIARLCSSNAGCEL